MIVTKKLFEARSNTATWEETWDGPDNGLIACWERGREKAVECPDVAASALNGELPILPWKGGVERAIKVGHKYGTLQYLAMWQGLRGENLNIDMMTDVMLVCSKTGMKITFTPDASKYSADSGE